MQRTWRRCWTKARRSAFLLFVLGVAAIAAGTAPTAESTTVAPATRSVSTATKDTIAFDATRRGDNSEDVVYLATTIGTDVHAITPEGFGQPAWSPDGKRIAFFGPGGIWVARADGSSRHRLTHDEGFSPSWSPDGQGIIYSTNANKPQVPTDRFFIVKASGGPPRPFPMPLWDLDEHFDHATYSPDGKRIAFYAEADGGAFDGIFVVGVDGTHRRMIIDGGTAPAWSPDGRAIAYEYYDFARGASQIGLATADGKHQRRLALRGRSRIPREPGHPTWSPEGRRIVFADDQHAIWIANRDGTAAHRIIAAHLIDRAWVSSPTWQPRHR